MLFHSHTVNAACDGVRMHMYTYFISTNSPTSPPEPCSPHTSFRCLSPVPPAPASSEPVPAAEWTLGSAQPSLSGLLVPLNHRLQFILGVHEGTLKSLQFTFQAFNLLLNVLATCFNAHTLLLPLGHGTTSAHRVLRTVRR